MGSALISELIPEAKQGLWKALLISKFLTATAVVMIFPQFIIAIADYGSVMLTWGVVAIFTRRSWRKSIIAAVALSALAAWVQQSGISMSQHVNHNDLFHLIQALALIGFYRAATKMSHS